MGVAQGVRLSATMRWAGMGGLLVLMTGCQMANPVSSRRLIEHQALIDFSGLKPAEPIDGVKVTGAVPRQWEKLSLRKNALYSHQQWRSPSASTGVGVAYIHMPLPLSAKFVVSFAKAEYSKKEKGDGRLIAEWTDELGRSWFEAENSKYHVRGYVVTEGFSAWIVYFGYRVKSPPNPAEISLAARCAETIVPTLGDAPAEGEGQGKEPIAQAK